MSPIYLEDLEHDRQAMRILTLLPGPWEAPIECRLKRVYLDNHPVYEAVSYAWGDPGDRSTLLVENTSLHVPSNLETCLRYLRKPDESLQLWVDAICINQQDLKEKDRQVAIMGEIFRRCTLVYVWLGVAAVEDIGARCAHAPGTCTCAELHVGSMTERHRGSENVVDPFTMIHHFSANRHLHEFPCFQQDQSDGSWLFREDQSFEDTWASFKDIVQKPW